MGDDFTGKEDTPSVAAEVDEIYAWNETTTDNPIKAEILAEVNEVYHKYAGIPHSVDTGHPDPDHKLQSSIQGRSRKPETIYPPSITPLGT